MINNNPQICEKPCTHDKPSHETRLIVLTGGPGAGKTATLELIRKELCKHVAILPEAASIIFGGGFWRLESKTAVIAAQKAILNVQKQIENLVLEENAWSLGLCDRGIPDALAYWPTDEKYFWEAAGLNLQQAYDRYYSVIHLRTPEEGQGYNHQNPLRTETAEQAAIIDEKIHTIWCNHPHYHTIENAPDFLDKAQKVIEHVVQDLPEF